jgi:hypothetical protein
MFKSAFSHFFISPLSDIYASVKKTLFFIFQVLYTGLTLRDFKDRSNEENLDESSRVFHFLIFVLIGNIAYNEIFRGHDSNLWHEIKSQSLFTLGYFILFIIVYFLGELFNKIFRANFLDTLVTRLYNFYILIMLAVLQFSDSINPLLKVKVKDTLLAENAALVWMLIVLHLLFVYIKLFKAGIFTKRHAFFIIIFDALFLLILICFSLLTDSLIR